MNAPLGKNKLKDLKPQTVKEIHMYNGKQYVMNLSNSVLEISGEIFIKTPKGEYQIPSKEGIWHLHELFGRHIVSVTENGRYAYVEADNEYKIDINTYFDPYDFSYSSAPDFDTSLFYEDKKEELIKGRSCPFQELFEKFEAKDLYGISFQYNGNIKLVFYSTEVTILAPIKIEFNKEMYDFPSQEANWLLYQLLSLSLESLKENEENYVFSFENMTRIIVPKVSTFEQTALNIRLWFDEDKDRERSEFLY